MKIVKAKNGIAAGKDNTDAPVSSALETKDTNGDKKSIDQKLKDIDNNPRLNRRIERRYARYYKKVDAAQGDSEKLKKIEKKFGYNYEAAEKSGMKPDEHGHWGSIDENTGMILKAKRHPSIMKTRKTERALGYKIIKKDGERYSVPKNKQ